MMLPVLSQVLEQYRSWIDGRGAPIMCSAIHTVRCTLVLSFLVAAPNQTLMEVHREQCRTAAAAPGADHVSSRAEESTSAAGPF